MVKKIRTRKQSALLQALLFAVLLLLVNLISTQLYLRLDFTEDQRYTLSRSTKDLLRTLPEIVTVNAYFSEDLPPELLTVRREFQELLVEYESASKGQLVYAIENPNVDEETEQKAQQEGIAPVMVNIRKRDQVKQLRAYMGVSLYAGNKKEVIPFLQTDRSPEYALTTTLKKLTISNKPRVALLQGHDEPELETLQQLLQRLSILYEVQPFSLPDSAQIPTSYQALIWAAPKKQVSIANLDKVSQYLAGGGRLLLAYSPIQAELQTATPALRAAPELGIVTWLQEMGIYMQTSAVVVDAKCNYISVRQQVSGFAFNTQMEFPYFPVVQPAADHPISSDLESAVLQFSTAMGYAPKDSTLDMAAAVLLRSSERSGLQPLPNFIDLQKKWTVADFSAGAQTLALALKGASLPSPEAKLVVFGDQSLIVPQQQGQNVPNANLLLVTNAVDWLTDDTGLIDLRSKGISSRPLRELEDSTKTLLSYANMCVPIVLVLLYAVIRGQYRLRKRHRWLAQR